MAWHSILPGREIPEPRADAAAAESFGPCRLSQTAIHLPGRRYLPFPAVERLRLYASRLNTRGCCGLGIPIWYVLVYYGAGEPLRLLTEERADAEALLERISSRCPGAEIMEPNQAAR